jgi:hypothetical protein
MRALRKTPTGASILLEQIMDCLLEIDGILVWNIFGMVNLIHFDEANNCRDGYDYHLKKVHVRDRVRDILYENTVGIYFA